MEQLSNIDIIGKLSNKIPNIKIAKKLGVRKRTVERWLKGESNPAFYIRPALEQLYFEFYKEKTRKSGGFKFIDLFAGIGGFRMAFESIGGECVYTSEWNEYSLKTYSANFDIDHKVDRDITKISEDNIPDHDVLLAGFPCQPFSIAGVSKKKSMGKAHGFQCKTQGTLFFDIARIIKAKQPKSFVLENVKNLQSHDKGRTFNTIMETLENELGYNCSFQTIDAANFLPQHRERIFIIGFKDYSKFDFSLVKIPSDKKKPVLGTILHPEDGSEIPESHYTIGNNAEVNKKYYLSDKLWSYLQVYAAKHKAKGNGFGYSLFGPQGVGRTLSARYYKDGSEILIETNGNLNPRRLTPRECSRLMGFDSSKKKFNIPVSDTQSYKQFGNSVAVPVVKAIAKAMKPYLIDVKQQKEFYN